MYKLRLTETGLSLIRSFRVQALCLKRTSLGIAFTPFTRDAWKTIVKSTQPLYTRSGGYNIIYGTDGISS